MAAWWSGRLGNEAVQEPGPMKKPISKTAYDKLKAQHVAAANSGTGKYANALYVHRKGDEVLNQTYSHGDHGLPSIETDGKGKFFQFVKESVMDDKLDEMIDAVVDGCSPATAVAEAVRGKKAVVSGGEEEEQPTTTVSRKMTGKMSQVS
jgi:hypothetical protein